MKYLEHLNSDYIPVDKTIKLILLSIYYFEKVNQSTINSPLNKLWNCYMCAIPLKYRHTLPQFPITTETAHAKTK